MDLAFIDLPKTQGEKLVDQYQENNQLDIKKFPLLSKFSAMKTISEPIFKNDSDIIKHHKSFYEYSFCFSDVSFEIKSREMVFVIRTDLHSWYWDIHQEYSNEEIYQMLSQHLEKSNKHQKIYLNLVNNHIDWKDSLYVFSPIKWNTIHRHISKEFVDFIKSTEKYNRYLTDNLLNNIYEDYKKLWV